MVVDACLGSGAPDTGRGTPGAVQTEVSAVLTFAGEGLAMPSAFEAAGVLWANSGGIVCASCKQAWRSFSHRLLLRPMPRGACLHQLHCFCVNVESVISAQKWRTSWPNMLN